MIKDFLVSPARACTEGRSQQAHWTGTPAAPVAIALELGPLVRLHRVLDREPACAYHEHVHWFAIAGLELADVTEPIAPFGYRVLEGVVRDHSSVPQLRG